MSLLALHGIEKRFGATVALSGVDLAVDAGEVHALIGENGAGKSTLLNILSGLLKPDAGSMFLADEPYTPKGPAEGRRSGIAHIHQELSICPQLSVSENIFLGTEGASPWMRRDQLNQRAAPLLAEFGRGEIDPGMRAGRLTLADRQVVEICRALARDARIILMDEPTSSLQRGDVDRLFRLIAQLRTRGVAVLYISHFLEEVREICGRFTVLRDGRSVKTGDLAPVSNEDLIDAMVGRAIDSVFPPRSAANAGDVVLEVCDLASPPRLHAASFELRRGEILGIAGLIGSGRTDLVRTLFGLQRATAGRIVTQRGTLGYLSEDRKGEGLALSLSVADNVTLARLSACARGGWIRRSVQDMQTTSVMHRLRIKAAGPRAPVGRLSGGNQQKVGVGRLLHQDPNILLLDEPARGIDIASKSDIYTEVVQLARDGKAVLMVSSYLPELLGICDRIAVMSRGRLSPARPVAEWTADSIMEAAVGAPPAA